MKCPSCNIENRTGRRFCSECGSSLTSSCPDCGFVNGPDEKFCGGCGKPISETNDKKVTTNNDSQVEELASGDRRQVSIMYADLTGYTRLSETLDAEELHETVGFVLGAIDRAVEVHGGTVHRHIGDEVMAIFGAPVSHSDDPLRAVLAAFEAHKTVAALSGELGHPLAIHAGVASGEVVIAQQGNPEPGGGTDFAVTGLAANLASRLTGLADPGETVISDFVHQAIESQIYCERLPEISVKGIEKPISPWRALSLRESFGSNSEVSFVGRHSELAQFSAVLSTCQEEGVGHTILIRGEPGIGKTRLTTEMREIAERQGFHCHKGLILDFGSSQGTEAIGAVVLGLLGAPPTSSISEREVAVQDAIADGLVEVNQRGFLYDILGMPEPPSLKALYDAMDNTTRAKGRFDLISSLIETACAKTPQIFVIEDIHWSNAGTLAYLARMAELTQACEAVMVMTTRIEGDPIDPEWRAAAGRTPLMTIDLGPLREAESWELANEIINGDESFAQICVSRAEGSPLFLEQLLRGSENDAGSIPGTIQSSVMARVDQLDNTDRLALQAAAAVGQQFSLELLQYLMEDSNYDCRGLVQRYLIRPEGSGFLFAHALVRDSVYSSLLKPRRIALHVRAAKWFASRELALYAEHLDRAEDPRAVEAYLAAAVEESKAYRNDSALRLSERGLAIADRSQQHEILCFRGNLLRGLGEIDNSISAFESALSESRDDVERSRAWIGLAEGLRVSDRTEEALKALDSAEVTAAEGPPLFLAEIHHLRGNLYFPAGRFDVCLTEHEQALSFARDAGSSDWEARALGGLGDASYLAGQMRTAYRHFQNCVNLCQGLGLSSIEVSNRHMVGWSRIYLNEITQACEDGLASAEMAEQVGLSRAEMLGRQLAGFMYLEQGQLIPAREQTERATALARRLGANNFLAEGLCYLAKVLIAEGRSDEARRYIEESESILREVGMTFFGPFILGISAKLTNDPSRRSSLLDEAVKVLEDGCVSHNYFWFYRDAIESSLELQDWPTAERFADALEEYTSNEPLPWSDLFVKRGRALTRFGRGERGLELASELDRLVSVTKAAHLNAYLPALESAKGAC